MDQIALHFLNDSASQILQGANDLRTNFLGLKVVGKDDEPPGRLQNAVDFLEKVTPLLGREVVIVQHVDQKNQVD